MNRPVEWPDKAAFTPTTIGGMAPWDKAEYERAMKEAALNALHILVGACGDEGHIHTEKSTCFICKALHEIGPLPEQGPRTGTPQRGET